VLPARSNRVTDLYDRLGLHGQMHHLSGATVAEYLLTEYGCAPDFCRDVAEIIRGHVKPTPPSPPYEGGGRGGTAAVWRTTTRSGPAPSPRHFRPNPASPIASGAPSAPTTWSPARASTSTSTARKPAAGAATFPNGRPSRSPPPARPTPKPCPSA
jgi:hypothetical protein